MNNISKFGSSLMVLLLGLLPISEALAQNKATAGARLRIMSYNVENLFDTEHDSGKNDWEYLPANYPGRKEQCEKQKTPEQVKFCLTIDWTPEKLDLKIGQIEKVFRSAGGAALPEIAGLVEIENEAVVAKLAKKLGYQRWFVTDSPDERGIDVALMFQETKDLRFVKQTEHILDSKLTDKPTRNILEVEFNFDGQKLFVFVNHWPSQNAPSQIRMNVAQFVMNVVKARKADSPDAKIVVLGDFNIINTDRPDPIHGSVLAADGGALIDVDSYVRANAKRFGINVFQMPIATYFYGPKFEWNLLDRFFISQNMVEKVKSYRILAEPEFKTTWMPRKGDYLEGTVVTGVPLRYDHNKTSDPGFSDHFGILFEIEN